NLLARNFTQLVGNKRVAADEDRIHALLTHLTDDEPGFGVVTAEIDDIDVRLLQLRNDGGVILLARRDRLIEHFLLARRVHGLAGFVRETLTIGGLVVQDGDVLVAELLSQVFSGDGALLVIAAADAEAVRAGALIGEFRVGGSG